MLDQSLTNFQLILIMGSHMRFQGLILFWALTTLWIQCRFFGSARVFVAAEDGGGFGAAEALVSNCSTCCIQVTGFRNPRSCHPDTVLILELTRCIQRNHN